MPFKLWVRLQGQWLGYKADVSGCLWLLWKVYNLIYLDFKMIQGDLWLSIKLWFMGSVEF